MKVNRVDGYRLAAVAGSFYPNDSSQLTRTVERLISESHVIKPLWSTHFPRLFIAPHAGIQYSGKFAAPVYRLIHDIALNYQIDCIVILCPCHRVAVSGYALSDYQFFSTPIGTVPVDHEKQELILQLKEAQIFNPTHENEHAIEVQLPFLQTVLTSFKIVPIVVGETSDNDLNALFKRLWQFERTLILISSDLSHFKNYDDARYFDHQTLQLIENKDYKNINSQMACGVYALRGALALAARENLTAQCLAAGNSGDTAGDHSRVVGYASYAFF